MKEKETGLSPLALAMMALGTIVGGSFFIGSAIAIKSSGSSILVAYLLGGGLVYFILFALSELTVADPAPGSFRTFAQRAFGNGVGFVVGWVYWTGLVLSMSSEATAAALLLKGWIQLPLPLMGGMIVISVTLLNLLGAKKLSKLESGLAGIKLLAIVGFILLAIGLILGMLEHDGPVGMELLYEEPFFQNGLKGIAGSMLIVMFTYAGFEILGLAASETSNPNETVPKAIRYTVISLVGLYIIAIGLLLMLVKTTQLKEEVSPFVLALKIQGIPWAAKVINIVLLTAILSTMLASTFGLGRMIRSLADEGLAPSFIKDRKDVPYRGIIFSGIAMLLGLAMSFVLPKKIYLFLVSSGGFSLLFTYLIILLTHYRFRKKNGCPPSGQCQMCGFPYTSWGAITFLILIIASMPLIKGQGAGLIAGLILIGFYTLCYQVQKHMNKM